ncbi:cytochrome P450 [Lactarius indigo]|nr:cytochrome P450 [Lactarius indigo]
MQTGHSEYHYSYKKGRRGTPNRKYGTETRQQKCKDTVTEGTRGGRVHKEAIIALLFCLCDEGGFYSGQREKGPDALVVPEKTTETRYLLSPWRKLPPGPRGLPLLGNVLQLRQELRSQQWLTFVKWKQEFGRTHFALRHRGANLSHCSTFSGDVFYLNAAGQPIVVLNSQKVAADLLDRRAGIYSDRPRNIVAAQILCGGLLVAFQNSGPLWRRMRKAVHECLSIAESLKVPQLNEALLLTSGLIAQPATMDNHLRRATASMIMSVTYGTPPIVSELDPGIKAINDFVTRLTRALLPGTHFVEFFPWMRHIPSRFAKWKRDAEYWYEKDSVMFESLFNSVREKMRSTGSPDRENSWVAATMYTETCSSMSSTTVVGRTRTPTFADFQHLPYIRAMVKETLRWCPVGPVGIPHLSSEDDWYNGMFIPKGTIMIVNIWHLHRDPEIYGADAVDFNPARFLDANGDLAPCPPETKEEGHVTYGFGRRICAGKHVANNSLFIDMAMTLWACNIEAGKDEHGNVIPIDVNGLVENGIAVRPVPFKADITPRFPEVVGLLASEREFREP